MSVFLNQFDSFYITTNDKLVLRYKIGDEIYMNYILEDIKKYKNLILKPQKILTSLDIFPLESLVV